MARESRGKICFLPRRAQVPAAPAPVRWDCKTGAKLEVSLPAAILAFALVLAGARLPCVQAYPAEVSDLSDRGYHENVVHLIRGAKESVAISMYLMRPQEPGAKGFIQRHPVDELLRVLAETARRGVRVTVYLNTHFKESGGHKANIGRGALFDELRSAGAQVLLVSDARRLHDKLVIVDERYVVEGSMNWSLLALRTNHESSTLIDSAPLAREKLARLARLTLEGGSEAGALTVPEPETGKTVSGADDSEAPEAAMVFISKEFVLNPKYAGAMLAAPDERTFDLYILLLEESARAASGSFRFDFESMDDRLKLPPDWDDVRKRRQIIKVLKKLEKRYRLARTEFRFGKDAWVELIPLPGASFQLPPVFFEFEPPLSLKAKYAFLVRELFASDSEPLPSYIELGRMLGVHPRNLGDGFRELTGHPLAAAPAPMRRDRNTSAKLDVPLPARDSAPQGRET